MRTWIVWGTLALLASLTGYHNATVWTSERSLWAHAVTVAPEHPRPWINLGQQAYLAGDSDAARSAWTEAARVSQLPNRSPYEQAYGLAAAQTNLAFLLAHDGQSEQALTLVTAVLDQQPHLPAALQLRSELRRGADTCVGARDDWDQYRIYGLAGVDAEMPAC